MKIYSYHISSNTLLWIATDSVCVVVSVVLARLVAFGAVDGWALSLEFRGIATMATYVLLILLAMGAMGLYTARQRYGLEGALTRTFVGVCLAAMLMAMFAFLIAFSQSRLVWLLAFAITMVLLGLLRVYFHSYLGDNLFRRRVLVFGAGRRAARIAQLRRHSDQRDFLIVAFLPAPGDAEAIDDRRVLKKLDCSLREYVVDNDIDEIVVAMDDRRRNLPISDLLECKFSGIVITDVLAFLERESGRVKLDLMNPSWLIFSEDFNRRNRRRISFRLVDLIVSGILLIVALPIMLVIAAAIVMDDGWPVLYRQQRVGLNGANFTLYKFRSMRVGAEAEGGAVWAVAEDPRVTRVGRWLRKYRLDELPQLVNVLRADMSIVGPRPERPEFVDELTKTIPYYMERHSVKPGMTGWAQLSYGYGASERDTLVKLEFDLYYIKHRSILFYLTILLQTAEVVLWQKGSR